MSGYKDLFFNVSALMLKHISLNKLISLTKKKFVMPLYHCVSENAPDHIRHLYHVKSVSEFEEDLDSILKYYNPVIPSDLKSIIDNGGKVAKNSFILTFDDGLREFYEVITPILLRKGIPAICFLNSDFVGNTALFFRYKASTLTAYSLKNEIKLTRKDFLDAGLPAEQLEKLSEAFPLLSLGYRYKNVIDALAVKTGCDFEKYLNKVKPYMNQDEIKQLIDKGFLFGAHSMDHPLFSEIDEEDQLKQTTESMNFVQNTFDLDYRYFAFPFTDTGVKESFFKSLHSGSNKIDLTFGTSGLKNDPTTHHWQRIPMEYGKDNAENILKSEYLYYLMKAYLGKNTIRRS